MVFTQRIPLLGLGFLITMASACRVEHEPLVGDAGDSVASVVASLDSVSPELQNSEDLKYRLLCAKDRTLPLEELAVVESKKGDGALNTLSFNLKQPVLIGSVCRVEIRSSDAKSVATKYDFPVESGLFYSTTKGEVLKTPSGKAQLEINIYQVFGDKKAALKKVTSEVSFPAEVVEGKFALNLLCGEKVYLGAFTLTADAKIYRDGFVIPAADLTTDLSCQKVTATRDDGKVKLQAALSENFKISASGKELVKVQLALIPDSTSSVDTLLTPASCKDGELFNPATDKCEGK